MECERSGGRQASLAPAIATVGTPRFVRELHGAIDHVVKASHVTIVEFSPRLTPSAFLISSRRQELRAERHARAYFEEYYKYDPNYYTIGDLASRRSISIVRRDIGEFSADYRSRFFEDQEISDKISIFHSIDQMLVVTNIYKDEQDGEFGDQEIDRIAEVSPLLSTLASRHCQLLGVSRIDLEMIAYAMAARRAICFTSREVDVCQGILRGQSSEAIGLSLGIAPSSVITHRKNIYRKLNIVSQAELFSCAFDTVSGRAA